MSSITEYSDNPLTQGVTPTASPAAPSTGKKKMGVPDILKNNPVSKAVVGTVNKVEHLVEEGVTASVRGVKKVGENVDKTARKVGTDIKHTARDINKLAVDSGLIPPLTPIPFKYFVTLQFITLIPAITFISCFANMGWGLNGYKFAVENADFGWWCNSISTMSFLTLYLLDYSYWESNCMIWLGRGLISAMSILFGLGIFFNAAEYPASPITVFMLTLPFYLMSFKYILFFVDFRNYVNWLSTPLFITATCTALTWFGWTFRANDSEWTPKVRNYNAHYIGCTPNFDVKTGYPECAAHWDALDNEWDCNLPLNLDRQNSTLSRCPSDPDGVDCDDVYDTCGAAFLVWVNPLAVATGFYFLSFIFAFMNPEHKDASPQAFVKFFMVICFMFWIASSLAAANAGIADALFSFVVFMCLSAAIVALMVLGKKQVQGKIEEGLVAKMKAKFGGYGTLFKGIFVLSCMPVVFGYWGLSLLNQTIRRLRMPLSKQLTDEDKTFALTLVASKQKSAIMHWEWTAVILSSLRVGVFVQLMGVLITKFTYLFLAWLRVYISDWSLGQVTACMSFVGVTLFLLPPVPGIPVYFMSGMMLLGVAERAGMSLFAGVVYCSGLGLCLKLTAGTIQQQIFGKRLGTLVSVRQMVGVNGDMMRAVRVIMADKGLTPGKCAILTGGPDWPTFVTTGILGCEFLPVFIGTFPCVVLIVPTVLSGMFVYLQGDNGPDLDGDGKGDSEPREWAGTVYTIAMMVTGLAQFGTMFIAAHYLEQAQVDRKDEIDAIPIDQDVLAEDEKVKEKQRVFNEVTKWELLPKPQRMLLLSALFIMMTSCWMVMVFTNSCFKPFEMSSTIKDDLDGDTWSMVKTPGWASIVMFVIATIMLNVFNSWAGKLVDAVQKRGEGVVGEGDNKL